MFNKKGKHIVPHPTQKWWISRPDMHISFSHVSAETFFCMSLKTQSAGTFLVNQRTVKALQSTIPTTERLPGLAVVAYRGVTSDHDNWSTGHIYAAYTQDLQSLSFGFFQSFFPALSCNKKPKQNKTKSSKNHGYFKTVFLTPCPQLFKKYQLKSYF